MWLRSQTDLFTGRVEEREAAGCVYINSEIFAEKHI